MDAPLHVVTAAAAIVAAIPLLVWGIASANSSSSDRIHDNLQRAAVAGDGGNAPGPVARLVIQPVRALGRRTRSLTPAAWVEHLDRRLQLAGAPRAWPLERVLGAKLILGLVGIGIAGTLLGSEVSPLNLLSALIAVAGMYAAPDLILWGRAQERQAAIRVALPDTLDQMTISMEAGIGFDAAVMKATEAGYGPLSDELRRVLAEIKLGTGRREAFQHLVDRTDVPELRTFVFAVNQADQYGLPISQVLRVQAKEVRLRRHQRAEEQALKIPVKIVLPLVACIFPSLFIILLGPAAIRIARVLL